jgi:hypothetical protein
MLTFTSVVLYVNDDTYVRSSESSCMINHSQNVSEFLAKLVYMVLISDAVPTLNVK